MFYILDSLESVNIFATSVRRKCVSVVVFFLSSKACLFSCPRLSKRLITVLSSRQITTRWINIRGKITLCAREIFIQWIALER